MLQKPYDTSAPIHALFAQRYSGVCFDPQRPVPPELLLSVAEAARWAPSCNGDEPWRFLICNKATTPAAWDKAFACLMEGNQAWCRHAPVLVIICTDTRFTHNDNPNRFGPYDCGAAALSLCLQATAHGLMTHQMGGFLPAKTQESFAIPERYQPLAMMALGYQLPESEFPAQWRERETKPRQRRPLGAQFFAGEWGKGL
ncbi:MAG: nitroreductase family protein [Pseudomonadales bacterium]|jgi:nitroreductase|nr:nitroreductase family protein [Pseudomonadales bacterium]